MIFLRHGAYDEGAEVLNERGHIQTVQAITLLKKLGDCPTIISSEGPRAKQTAEMVANEFGTTFEIVSWLSKPSKDRPLHLDVVMEEIRRISVDGSLLLVTNGEFIYEFINQFSRKQQIKNSLKPLVKGDVMLCRVDNAGMDVEYF